MATAERSEVIDVPLRSFFFAVTNYERYPKFATGVASTRVDQQSPEGARVHFQVEMLKSVDYTLDLKHQLDPEGRSAEVSWTLAESKFFKQSNGLWHLKSLGPDKCEVLYRLEIEFSFPVPSFVLKKLVASALPKAIQDFANEARKTQLESL